MNGSVENSTASQLLSDHCRWMALAIQLARKGLYTTHPNPRVGCVVVKDGQLVGQGWHQHAGQGHAEVNALRDAGNLAQGATAYVTLEPCCHTGKTPPCTNALIEAKVSRVVVAMQDPNPLVAGNGIELLRQQGIEVSSGVLEAESIALNPGFIQRMTHKRPWVRCKMAMSLDGRTALHNGQSKWITGSAARADVQRWRAQSSAILTGINTILADDPSMNVRLKDWQGERPECWRHQEDLLQPDLFVLDSHLRVSPQAKIFSVARKNHLITASSRASSTQSAQSQAKKSQQLMDKGANVVALKSSVTGVDLKEVLAFLATQEVNELWVESGAALAGQMAGHNLIDEYVIYIASKLMGDRAQPLFKLPKYESMGDIPQLVWQDVRQIGDDLRVIARPI